MDNALQLNALPHHGLKGHHQGKKKLAILVGSKKAIAMAVKNDKAVKRFTGVGGRYAEVVILLE